MFYIFTYISSFFFLMSCNDWFMLWFSLEMNMFSFLLIMSNKISNSVESSIKYFFIQSLGSSLLMMSFYSQSGFEVSANMLILSYKMGAGPFFFWFPSVCSMISWGSCLILMSLQKIMPLVLISMYISSILWLIIIISMMVGVLGIINQTSIKRLMAFSSIHHIGWILMCNIIFDYMWLLYMVGYVFMILGVVIIMMKYEGLFINFSNIVQEKLMLIMGILSMGGMPPMLGFFLKWWVFSFVLKLDIILLIFMMMMSVMMLYYYMRIVFSLLYGENSFISWVGFNMKMFNFKSYEMMFLLGTFIGPLVGIFFI